MATSPQSMTRSIQRGARSLRFPFGLDWTTVSLIGIVLVAAVLRFANIGAIGESNTYYTAAVKSMLQSWHNFFFLAAEPGGSVSIDKPPVGLWLETISAYFLGVSGFAVVLPQILAGLFSVVLLFHLVRRWFGNVAGLVAAFALAVTPVAIAVERNNTPDGTLIFTLLLAAWAFIKATETRRLRFLLLGALAVGVGFNIKMMQAFLPLPAFYALYLFGSQQGWRRKIWHLGVTTLVLIPIALSWAVAVDLTPADQRPYVGSSSTNSELNLILGYNGIQRLLGGMGGPGGARDGDQSASQPPMNGSMPAGAPPDGFAGPGGPGGFGGPGGMFGTGSPGALRLFQSGLAAQVSWLLPFGLLSVGMIVLSRSCRRPQSEWHRGVILWGGWLLTCAAFFSVAGFFHQYYLSMLGPPLAAAVAMGVVFLWKLRKSQPVRAGLLLLVAAASTLAFQMYAVNMYGSLAWWIALPVVLGLLGLGLLLFSLRRESSRLPQFAFALIVAAMLVVPSVWSGLTTAYANTSSGLTQAYAGNSRQPGMFGRDGQSNMRGPDQGVNQNLLSYLEARTQDAKYLLVVPSSMAGAEYVLATGRPVLYAGGFNGSDPVIDGTSLAKLVANGDVRYVLWGGDRGPGGGTNSSITGYLTSSCSVVDDASLNLAQSSGGPVGASTLYQCGS